MSIHHVNLRGLHLDSRFHGNDNNDTIQYLKQKRHEIDSCL